MRTWLSLTRIRESKLKLFLRNWKITKIRNTLPFSYLLFCVSCLRTSPGDNLVDPASSIVYVPHSSLHFQKSPRTFVWKMDLANHCLWTVFRRDFQTQEHTLNFLMRLLVLNYFSTPQTFPSTLGWKVRNFAQLSLFHCEVSKWPITN